MDFPAFPSENGYRRDDYIVGCPDLIEPLSLHSRLSPTGKWAIKEFGMATVFFFFFFLFCCCFFFGGGNGTRVPTEWNSEILGNNSD